MDLLKASHWAVLVVWGLHAAGDSLAQLEGPVSTAWKSSGLPRAGHQAMWKAVGQHLLKFNMSLGQQPHSEQPDLEMKHKWVGLCAGTLPWGPKLVAKWLPVTQGWVSKLQSPTAWNIMQPQKGPSEEAASSRFHRDFYKASLRTSWYRKMCETGCHCVMN